MSRRANSKGHGSAHIVLPLMRLQAVALQEDLRRACESLGSTTRATQRAVGVSRP
jgi:hypothetical protein